jgi:hypothetical protein
VLRARLQGMDNHTLMTTWCAMWSEDPELAHQVLAKDGRQWSGQTNALDPVVGPDQQVEFVTGYRAQHVNVFTARVLADGGDRFAYLWDVRLPDGTVHTGLDVNVVRDGLVADNWTFASGRSCDLPDPAETDDTRLDAAELAAVAARWVAVWDGAVEQAAALVTEDYLAWSASTEVEQEGTGPDVLAARVEQERTRHDSLAVALHQQPVVDVARQRVALLWTATGDRDGARTEIGGVDLLALSGGRVSRSWTLRGTRPFLY